MAFYAHTAEDENRKPLPEKHWQLLNVHLRNVADLAGYEVAKGTLVWRALPVWSASLGLNGKCDIVEVVGAGSAEYASVMSELKTGAATLRPVECKKGQRRAFDNDDAQVCAQGLCLEDMFETTVERGAVFHADSKRRREVEFTSELRALTEAAIAEVRALWAQFEISDLKFEIPSLPAAEYKKACEECSLFDIYLPKATESNSRAARLNRDLFSV